jgi:uncharacterized protein with HEPN domain
VNAIDLEVIYQSTLQIARELTLNMLQIIGEAVRALPEEIRDRMPDVPWLKIVGQKEE